MSDTNDPQLQPIEELLRRLPVRRPSPQLDERVWAARPRMLLTWNKALWGALLAASLLGGATLLWPVLPRDRGNGRPEVGVEPPGPVLAAKRELPPAPIRIEQVWATAAPQGVIFASDAPPVRRVHEQVVRQIRWIDDYRHVRIEWNIPSEKTVLVPLVEYN